MGHWLSRQMGMWVGSGERGVKVITGNNTPYTQNNAEEDRHQQGTNRAVGENPDLRPMMKGHSPEGPGFESGTFPSS